MLCVLRNAPPRDHGDDTQPEFPGYRWAYDLGAAAGATFDVSAGYVLNRARLELSFGQRQNDVDQMFRSVTTLDGIALLSSSRK